MAVFDVNMDKVVGLTAKLERLHKSAFPVAVRSTLNDAAFDTKRNVPKVAAQKFTTRQKSFFRAFSIVDKATGWNVNNMKSVTGINAKKGNKVAEGLERQEFGGTLNTRKLLPMNSARISGSQSKRVQRNKQFRNLGNTMRAKGRLRGGTKQSRFIAAVMKAKSENNQNVIISNGDHGTLYRIRNSRRLKNGNTKLRLTPLYHYRESDQTKLDRSPFMAPSARMASKKMNDFYKKRAEQQFQRLLG